MEYIKQIKSDIEDIFISMILWVWTASIVILVYFLIFYFNEQRKLSIIMSIPYDMKA